MTFRYGLDLELPAAAFIGQKTVLAFKVIVWTRKNESWAQKTSPNGTTEWVLILDEKPFHLLNAKKVNTFTLKAKTVFCPMNAAAGNSKSNPYLKVMEKGEKGCIELSTNQKIYKYEQDAGTQIYRIGKEGKEIKVNEEVFLELIEQDLEIEE
jgi:hypothetical protein